MLGKLENVLLGLGAVAVLALGLMISANVAARALFDTALPDTVTFVREMMVAAILFPLAAATAARAHVAVEFVTNWFGPRTRSWLIVMGSVIGMLALTPLLFAGWREFSSNWTSGGFFYGDLNLPKWPGRLLFLIGIAACWIRLAELAIRDTRTILSGGIVPTNSDEQDTA
ncbi:TRAP transporter small permease [Litoreibacter roseus]|uniref:TRAP transporter small permease protein n=1 Tax=Litoreibacter roseus TaxID=2601869 RepID=A0A6N6JK72_9RHOB|nr:TRAP transporter small permease subunit [Litoreibacter roseus]GFE65592.1 hypothetical protein KIN_26660 [Litoreibacter roseus]